MCVSHRAMTLVELLIVLCVIGMLMQVLLPAVEASRESARTIACQNNLRQAGLGMLMHESTLHYLPTAGWGWGWIGDPDRGAGTTQSGSWCYQLLPYMEYNEVHDIGRGVSGERKYEALATLAATVVSTFYCPSRRLARAYPNTYRPVEGPQVLGNELFWYNAKRAESLAKTDYAANIGDLWVWWNEGPSPFYAEKGVGFFRFHTVGGGRVSVSSVSGTVLQRQPISLRQITDGTSKTYFAGEKMMAVTDYTTGSAFNDDQSCWNGDDRDLLCSTQYLPLEDPPQSLTYRSISFGSAHPNGFAMVNCDGSVHFISYNVDQSIHRQAGNRHDGESRTTLSP
jgi:hypothetical protein